MASGDDSNNPGNCYREWMNIQEQLHSELLQALTNYYGDQEGDHSERLTQLLHKNTKQLEDYVQKRSRLAHTHASSYFAPTWCSSLEASLLWAAGCRPTSFIRLLYILCGHETESLLSQDFQAGPAATAASSLGDLSSAQLNKINELHMETIKEEERLTSRLASLQEEVADCSPIALIAKEARSHKDSCREAEKVVDGIVGSLSTALEEADRLRMNTLKHLIAVLTPVQAVEFLVASKKLHLCIHAWGKRREHHHSATNQDQDATNSGTT